MKKIILLTVGLLVLCLNSCQKDSFDQPPVEIEDIVNLFQINDLGVLSFADKEDLDLACSKARALSLESHDILFEYINGKGVQTMEALTIEISENYSNVNTKEEYDIFMNTYRDKITITENKSIEVKNYVPQYAEFLNLKGEIIVNGRLEMYHPDFAIVISDGDYSKLQKALKRMESDANNGIRITHYINERLYTNPNTKNLKCGVEVNGQQGASLNRVSYFCSIGSPQSHRLENIFSVRRQLVFGPSNSCSNNWTVENYIACQILSKKRGFLGFWYAHRTPITWGIGWGVQGDPAVTNYKTGGTGWTTSSSQHKFYWETRIDDEPCVPDFSNLDRYKYYFDYIWTNASTAEISDCTYGCQ